MLERQMHYVQRIRQTTDWLPLRPWQKPVNWSTVAMNTGEYYPWQSDCPGYAMKWLKKGTLNNRIMIWSIIHRMYSKYNCEYRRQRYKPSNDNCNLKKLGFFSFKLHIQIKLRVFSFCTFDSRTDLPFKLCIMYPSKTPTSQAPIRLCVGTYVLDILSTVFLKDENVTAKQKFRLWHKSGFTD